LLISGGRSVLHFVVGSTVVTAACAVAIAWRVTTGAADAIVAAGMTFRVDSLSAYHLVVVMLVFLASSVFAVAYFEPEIANGGLRERKLRRFGALWLGSLAAMVLVLVSNNLGLMWVAMEATTVSTAFLIALHGDAAALEAMWKYLIVCSVGIAFAFMGTLLCAAAAPVSAAVSSEALLWTRLMAQRESLNPVLMRAAFVFLLVGYGTKAGLAPMHVWLPDAHSQAPAPVSAMFSGCMLNAALYCILRYVPLTSAVVPGFASGLLVSFGILSILVAAIFILTQDDAKRLLAYCSVEHLGIIALGFGLGPAGTQAALFHTLNHSICKSLGFFAVGRLGQAYGSHEMGRIRGALAAYPLWGSALLVSFLALIGVAPFATFMSEFQLLQSMVAGGKWTVLVLFLVGITVIFVPFLKYAVEMVFGESAQTTERLDSRMGSRMLVSSAAAGLLFLGLCMPVSLRGIIAGATAVVVGTP